jgi:hypothetical protein
MTLRELVRKNNIHWFEDWGVYVIGGIRIRQKGI